MIPEHIIEEAMRAYVDAEGAYCSRDSIASALEAVAADIWDQGYGNCWVYHTSEGLAGTGANPYRN